MGLYASGVRAFIIRSIKWVVPVGISVFAFQQYQIIRMRNDENFASLYGVKMYQFLPLRTFSRGWGWVAGLELPVWSRETLFGYYVRRYGCNMSEAEIEDVKHYKSFGELFTRSLKSGSRVIDEKARLVSPVDGTVLTVGRVENGTLEQIKGVTYDLCKFLGPNCWRFGGPVVSETNSKISTADNSACFHKSCLLNSPANDLYHAVIYLAPGDYHHFHSPAEWTVNFRRHFPGSLLSVSPSVVSWIQELFILNERCCYVGQWSHGFFSMSAVGATNVGSIHSDFDPQLKTNVKHWKRQKFLDHYFDDIQMLKGNDFGQFKLGSTIVLIFEAPNNVQFCISPGQKVKVGEPIMPM